MSSGDLTAELGEPVVVNETKNLYRPVGDWDADNYPDDLLGYKLDIQP